MRTAVPDNNKTSHPQPLKTLINQLVQKEIQTIGPSLKNSKEGLSLVEHETIQDSKTIRGLQISVALIIITLLIFISRIYILYTNKIIACDKTEMWPFFVSLTSSFTIVITALVTTLCVGVFKNTKK